MGESKTIMKIVPLTLWIFCLCSPECLFVTMPRFIHLEECVKSHVFGVKVDIEKVAIKYHRLKNS